MNLELVDVSVRLIPNEGPALACVNFIKSRLIIETYSNKSQDIDLISQEILITDTRFEGNIF
jgi:vacuolar protein sorting-associated protein 13D